MQDSDIILAKSIVTRFSHDMAGVVSAVSNSLSLLEDLGGGDEETIKLATDNAAILMGRLRFFRAAFGNEGPLSDIAVTQKIFEDYLKTLENKIVRYSCSWMTDGELPIFVFRQILIAGMIVAETLPRGGSVSVQALAGNRQIRIEAQGKTVQIDSQIQSALEGTVSDNEVSPKIMPAVFLKKYADEQKWEISVVVSDEKAVMLLKEKR